MLTVDSDGHILEPLDLWERYLEPKYRDRAIRRRLDKNGYEYLEFDREPMFLPAGTMGGWGGAYMDINELMIPGKLTYWDSAQRTPGAIDPHARVREMDEQGIDLAVLYPTVGLAWESQVTDPEICAAYCRAYNNYLFDFCPSRSVDTDSPRQFARRKSGRRGGRARQAQGQGHLHHAISGQRMPPWRPLL